MTPDVLCHSRKAPLELRKAAAFTSQSRIPFVSGVESAEEWLKFEQLLVSCIITGDDESATACLGHLEQRFGVENEKVQSLHSLYDEGKSSGQQVERITQKYEKELKATPANTAMAKRQAALLRGLGRDQEAITALCRLLDTTPTDIEAWAELADLYASRSMFRQSVYCLEEVLLVQPNAWNIHARIGEVSMKLAVSSNIEKQQALECTVSAYQHFCRSVELCNDFIRGYCGIKQASDRLLNLVHDNTNLMIEVPIPSVEKIRDHAMSVLWSITKAYPPSADAPIEVVAARLILDT